MSLKGMSKVSHVVFAVVVCGVFYETAPFRAQHAPGEAYTVRVQPCGEFGKPPCGTTVTIPAGATGESLFEMAKASVVANRTWEAMIYAEQSALRGYAPAESALGADFEAGLGVPKDMVKARYWLQKAADQGNGASQAALGEMYERALGGPANQALAVHYYMLSAAQHVPRGEMRLGMDYELGTGVPHDREKAISLLRSSAWEKDGVTWAMNYVNALSRAGTRRFGSLAELNAYVYPPQRQTQNQQSNVPAGCPAELNFPFGAGGMGQSTRFCWAHPGCPYQVGSIREEICPRLSPGIGVN